MNEQVKTKVDAVKAAGLPVFSVKMGARSFIYRGMNRREFRDLQTDLAKAADTIRAKFADNQAKMDSEIALLKEKGEEKLVLKCLIDPEIASELDVDTVPAGLITRLAELIMKASGFDDAEPSEPEQL